MSLGNFLQGVLVFAFLLLQAWLLFFYTSLALRENILRVNGSDIRPWYILFSPNLWFVLYVRLLCCNEMHNTVGG